VGWHHARHERREMNEDLKKVQDALVEQMCAPGISVSDFLWLKYKLSLLDISST
jgi:hypothetical protein